MTVEGGAPTQLERLAAIMKRLRDPQAGCPWDVAQTHESIARYAIEEAHEVVDAIDRKDWSDLRDELGDLALQVVFHSQIAAEAGRFGLADVLAAIGDKMERRHPRVFGNGDDPGWEALKASERSQGSDRSELAGVARALPALLRAQTLGARGARVGFDWSDLSGVMDKVVEELSEIADATSPSEQEAEFGDLLLTLVSWGRHQGIDAESALRGANARFEARFRLMETDVADLSVLDDAGKDRAWQRAKAAQRASNRDQSASDSRTDTASDPSATSERSSTSPRS